jgi:hypothetical protein
VSIRNIEDFMKKIALCTVILITSSIHSMVSPETVKKTKAYGRGIALGGVAVGTAAAATAAGFLTFAGVAGDILGSKGSKSPLEKMASTVNEELKGKSSLATVVCFPFACSKALWYEKKSLALCCLFGIVSAGLWSAVTPIGKLAMKSFIKKS